MIGLGTLLWAIIEAPNARWMWDRVLAVGATSFAGIGAFVAWKRRCAHPADLRF
jgi:hypothetical protein